MKFLRIVAVVLFFATSHFTTPTLLAAESNRANDSLPTPEEVSHMKPVDPVKAAALLKEVKHPDDFDVTIFAAAPAVNYPVFVATAPDGTVYVSSDGNGSLDRKPHRGRILRVRDLDDDGQADEVKVFVADVDSPRGLVWDHDRLYLLHPPNLSEFIDRDGDGVADEQRTLVKNIAFGFKDRPADHSSNGLELGVDGWLYAAIGDFGFLAAEGTDGRKLQLRGGGVVRLRTDGSELELYSRGTRNILEVAVSPLLDGFARDNTNDGGGWDIRFHHFTGFDDHGYPRLFKNFSDELVQPLADYGGGSGCGAAWIGEPGIPAQWNHAAFTADWGRNWIYHHGLKPAGATFTVGQKEFIGVTRPTDLDVDARSRVYVASWKGATFTWTGNDVGYLVQARPKNFKAEPVPDFIRAIDDSLVQLLESPSHRTRLEAQRTLLRRGLKPDAVLKLTALAGDASKALPTRIAATFALAQGLGTNGQANLLALAKDPQIEAWALRALADRQEGLQGVPSSPFVEALRSSDARTRREAVAGLGRWHGLIGAPADGEPQKRSTRGQAEISLHGKALATLLADSDPVVAHTAMQVMRQLHMAEPCFALLDSPGTGDRERAALLRMLGGLPNAEVVDGVVSRFGKEADAGRRAEWLATLCRLHFVEGKWNGTSWGTRPDTRGPYYQPEEWSETSRIAAILHRAISEANPRETARLAAEFERHRIPSEAAAEKLLSLAKDDSSMVPMVVSQFARASRVPPSVTPFLLNVTTSSVTKGEVRTQAIEALCRSELNDDATRAVLRGLSLLPAGRADRAGLNQAGEAFVSAPKLERQVGLLASEAARVDAQASLWADVALIRILDRAENSKARQIRSALDEGWTEAKRRLQLIEASILAQRKILGERIVAAVNDGDSTVADAARRAIRRLRLENSTGTGKAPLIGSMKVDDAVSAVLNAHGQVASGEQVFQRLGCVSCHTVRTEDPLKGPYLGNIATIYKRRELAEAVLVPNKSIAQGFVANRFALKDGDDIEGFVVQEASDAITIRNIAAQELKIKPADIVKRDKLEKSLMPEGLAATLTVQEFASLLDYLESLATNGK
jgi:putative membrane-bound dehydrogenase-like protein